MPWSGFDFGSRFKFRFSQYYLTRLLWFVLKGYIRFVRVLCRDLGVKLIVFCCFSVCVDSLLRTVTSHN